MNQTYKILHEEDVKKLLTVELANQVIHECFIEKAKGTFIAHPKINIKGKNGSLRITPGESQKTSKTIGFRLYDTIRNDYTIQPQLTVVYDNENGRLKGLIISQLLGAFRTASINAVMQAKFKKECFEVLGIIGTGFQARLHLQAFYNTLLPKKVVIYGRTPKNVLQFKNEMQRKLGILITIANSIEAVVKEADSLLLATRSQQAILPKGSLKKGVTITTIGPKLKNASEVSEELANECDLIATDSIEQIEAYGERFFITDRSRIIDFSDVVLQPKARKSDDEKILLCSVGMGGTEVALANALLEL